MQISPPNIAWVVTQVGREITPKGQVSSFKNRRGYTVQENKSPKSLEFPPCLPMAKLKAGKSLKSIPP